MCLFFGSIVLDNINLFLYYSMRYDDQCLLALTLKGKDRGEVGLCGGQIARGVGF